MPPIQRRGQLHALPPALRKASEEQAFAEVVAMIQASRSRVLAAINTDLVDLYWRVGEYISRKLETAAWGEGVVTELAGYIQRRHPNLRGFTRRNLFRMRQFFDAYGKAEVVPALLTQLPWTHHLLILGRCRQVEEREFYIRLATKEKWTSRHLERQLAGALFERAVLHPPQVSTALRQLHPDAEARGICSQTVGDRGDRVFLDPLGNRHLRLSWVFPGSGSHLAHHARASYRDPTRARHALH
jgi:predicted nuclease of restriction endonuclease-like (RecB) superfamily